MDLNVKENDKKTTSKSSSDRQKDAKDFKEELLQTVKELCVDRKGILSVDELNEIIGKRFESIGVKNTE